MSWFSDLAGGLLSEIPVVGGVASNLVTGGSGAKTVGCFPQVDAAAARALYADPVYYARVQDHVRSWKSSNARNKALDVNRAVQWANSPSDDCTANDAEWNAFLRGLIAEREAANNPWGAVTTPPPYMAPPASSVPSNTQGSISIGGGGVRASFGQSSGLTLTNPLVLALFGLVLLLVLRR